MKKTLLLLAALLALPLASQADVSIGVNVPGLSLHIGDRDNRGHYWTAIAGAIRAGGPITTGMNARAGTIMARRHG
ncbi:Uncharacterised protein [Serratia marcescens]|nr:Uncharacterised protein [Serratia marcescens]